MPLQIIEGDITKIHCDAIVNAANSTLLGGGGVDGAIHAVAGPELKLECARLGGCPTGRAKITKGYSLPCKYVIHAVGPVWKDGSHNEEAYLRSCYQESLALAVGHRCESIAFPLISGGSFGYPKEEALQIAVDEIGRFLLSYDMYVMLVVHSRSSFRVNRRLIEDVIRYIDDFYVEAHYFDGATTLSVPKANRGKPPAKKAPKPPLEYSMPQPRVPEMYHAEESVQIPPIVFDLDESFSEMLLRKIDERGMTDAECYKKANIDRKLFSKIRKNPQYRPSKTTAVAFAIALELPLEGAQDLLKKAGFALSHSSKFDIIIEYFIKNRNYNIFEINEVLFEFDQSLLGV